MFDNLVWFEVLLWGSENTRQKRTLFYWWDIIVLFL